MLFTILPVPDIFSAVWPKERPKPVFLVVLVLALIAATINPGYFALTVHAVVLPVALVVAVLEPDVFAYRLKMDMYLCRGSSCLETRLHSSSCLQTSRCLYRSWCHSYTPPHTPPHPATVPPRIRSVYHLSNPPHILPRSHGCRCLVHRPCHSPTHLHRRRRQRGIVFPGRWPGCFSTDRRIWSHRSRPGCRNLSACPGTTSLSSRCRYPARLFRFWSFTFCSGLSRLVNCLFRFCRGRLMCCSFIFSLILIALVSSWVIIKVEVLLPYFILHEVTLYFRVTLAFSRLPKPDSREYFLFRYF